MPNLEPDVPMTLKSSYGVVDLNTVSAFTTEGFAWLFRVLNDDHDYAIVPAKFRPVSDSVSQGDGSSIQPPYIDGLQATMSVSYWMCPDGNLESAVPACAEVLREMDQFLMGVLNGLRTFPTDVSTQQYAWLPTDNGGITRLLEGVMLAAWPTPDFSKGPPEVRRKVVVGSPYPYALQNDLITTVIPAGTSATVTNGGNIDQLPILFVHGPSTGVAVVNEASGLTVSYDSTRPGALAIPAGHILQIDFAEGTCLLDGDPDLDYVAGLDPAATDLWALKPNDPSAPGGSQVITVSAGAAVDVKHYWAWI